MFDNGGLKERWTSGLVDLSSLYIRSAAAPPCAISYLLTIIMIIMMRIRSTEIYLLVKERVLWREFVNSQDANDRAQHLVLLPFFSLFLFLFGLFVEFW